MKLRVKGNGGERERKPAPPQSRCRAVIVKEVRHGRAVEGQCSLSALHGFLYCKDHYNNIRRGKAVSTGYGIGYVGKLTRAYAQQYQGKIWDTSQEIAFLRALLQYFTENLLQADWITVGEEMERIGQFAEGIARMCEKQAKTEEGLKIKVEFKQLQEFVGFISQLLNKHVKDDKARGKIAIELGKYMEGLGGSSNEPQS